MPETETRAELLDVLASYARTALDDPGCMIDEQGRSIAGAEYAIDRLDDIINTLNPALEDRGSFAETLTALGRQLEDRRERIASLTPDTEPPDTAAYEAADCCLQLALDHIDDAINALNPEEG